MSDLEIGVNDAKIGRNVQEMGVIDAEIVRAIDAEIEWKRDVEKEMGLIDAKIEWERNKLKERGAIDAEIEGEKEGPPRPTIGSSSKIQDDRGTQNGSQSNNDLVIEIYKDDDLYLEARNGSLDAFRRVLDRVSAAGQTSFSDILRRLSSAGNTFLHIAAKQGNEDGVTYIAG